MAVINTNYLSLVAQGKLNKTQSALGTPLEPLASGLPTNGFLYVGFLPPKSSARIAFFEKYRTFDYTLALYESCHRIDKAVDEIVATLGPARVICVAKEVTKLHETFFVGGAADVQARLARASLKGEFVLLIAPPDFVL